MNLINGLERQMDMKNFFKYLKYKSFDEALHHARRISSERTAESESLIKVFQEGQNRKKAV
jgi:hypothetical protein